ncbi:putative tricarboxylic transport membrane protein [Kribbella antiqua]|uniref:Putative tricarboxylic transport membrane protein n=1 Tax=Kribbella antiqua TaxID=2512217 RepID=A0A4R2IHI7_9ACTN|nr:tripartite tricarboxylate transporter TctB family protein [Kribbella antiqua]TCO44401.1 putative tricarboxylic transport membrane protein [Kribbella antiqua]
MTEVNWSRRIVAIGFLVVAVVVLVSAFRIPVGGGYQAVGPRAFPLLVGGGLGVVAVVGAVQAFRPRDSVAAGSALEADDDGPIAWRPVLILLAALAGYAALLVPVGYWQSTTVFFVVCARVLGSRRLLRDAVIALVLALATYVLFDRVLGITLPPGFVRLAI